jgi:hypothetical protein
MPVRFEITSNTKGRLFLWLLFFYLAYYQVDKGILPGMDMQSDFPNYYSSAKLVAGNDLDSLYDNRWFNDQIKKYGMDKEGKFAPFTPPTAFVMLPLVPFDPLTAKRIWMGVNIALLFGCGVLLSRMFSLSLLLSMVMILLCGRGLVNNLYLGQVYLLIVFITLFGWSFIRSNKFFAGGFCWGIASSVKIFPAIFILPFVWKGNRQLLTGFASGLILPFIFAAMIMGGHVIVDYFSVLAEHLNGKIEGQSPFAYQFQSWNAYLRRLFVYDSTENPAPWVSSPILFGVARFVVFAGVAGLTAFVLYQIRHHRKAASFSVALVGIAAFEILPASASYHLILLLLPLALLYNALESKNYKTILLVSFGMIGFLPQWILEYMPPGIGWSFSRLFLVTLFFILSLKAVQAEAKPESAITA